MHLLRYFCLFFCLGSSSGWNLFPWRATKNSLGNFTREKLSSLRNQRNRLQSLVIEEKRAEIGKKVTLNSSLATKFSRKNFVKNFVPVNEIIEKKSDKRKPQSFDPRLELVDRMLKSEKMKNILNLFPAEFGIKIKKILKIDGLKNSHEDSSGINFAASRGGGGGGWGWGMGGEIDAFTILAALAFLTSQTCPWRKNPVDVKKIPHGSMKTKTIVLLTILVIALFCIFEANVVEARCRGLRRAACYAKCAQKGLVCIWPDGRCQCETF
ncbi:uncharacterized protein LOC118439240 [Folsomia candida]|uniref:uncharacterized protein LOC118439240 n=1 Tax=Folsomia candida TaxID=158441 RepID=UPI0016054DD4|nr:uncharacterized protein LOC118439240 [Folsomia candida]